MATENPAPDRSSSSSADKIRVAFLCFYFEAWDALDEVYRIMASDVRFDPVIVVIPRKLTGQAQYGDIEKVKAHFDALGLPYLALDHDDSFEGLARLRELAPDYLFINYPWQRNYQPAYRVDRLIEFTRVCYVPYYSLPLTNEPGVHGIAPHLFTQRSHQLASLVFTQDEAVRQAYASTDRGNAHVHLTGTPKIDRLRRLAQEGSSAWPIEGDESGGARGAAGSNGHSDTGTSNRKYRMVWAPHHSYSPHWLNFGTFREDHEDFLRFATENPDIDIVLRPHPFLFGTLVDREVLPADHLERWLASWNALPNTAIDADGSYAELFLATDLLVTDGISFLGEYPLITGEPAVFIEHPEHWEFSPLGQLAAASTVRHRSFAEFEAAIAKYRRDGLPSRAEQIEALAKASNPFPGEAAQRIVEVVAADRVAGTGLVDSSLVKTVAWEDRPGTEPKDD